MVYIAEKNRGSTLRVHYMLLASWVVGALKTLSQIQFAIQTNRLPLTFAFVFVLMLQLANITLRILASKKLSSLQTVDKLHQEARKCWLSIVQDIAFMTCMVLSDPLSPQSAVPLSIMLSTTFLGVLDMFRLATLFRLHISRWICFLLLELDHYLRVPGTKTTKIMYDILFAFLFGTLLPFAFTAVSEAHEREVFLQECRKPSNLLGPVWTKVLSYKRRILGPFPRQRRVRSESDHTD